MEAGSSQEFIALPVRSAGLDGDGQSFHDLNGIESRALSQLIAGDEEIDRIRVGKVAANAPDKHFVPVRRLHRGRKVILLAIINDHDSGKGRQGIAHGIPLTFAEKVLIELMRDGKSWMDKMPSFLALIGFGVGLLTLASVTLREAD